MRVQIKSTNDNSEPVKVRNRSLATKKGGKK